MQDVKVAARTRTEQRKEKVLASAHEASDHYQGLPLPAQVAVAVAPVVLMLALVIRKIRS